ncbi:MAG TPA: cupin domain-containing protein [Acidimicrobiales bacterium]|nr:cupin domain-containing protein [Acidimicrobiales bacterium]
MRKEELEFFDVRRLPWVDLGAGLAEQVLAGDPASGHYTRLLRFEPGTVTDDTVVHDFWEEVWIVSGSIIDLRLQQEFRAGMYACRPPSMRHGPWRSPEGCVTFEVRYRLSGNEDSAA